MDSSKIKLCGSTVKEKKKESGDGGMAQTCRTEGGSGLFVQYTQCYNIKYSHTLRHTVKRQPGHLLMHLQFHTSVLT